MVEKKKLNLIDLIPSEKIKSQIVDRITRYGMDTDDIRVIEITEDEICYYFKTILSNKHSFTVIGMR